ncbi:right-handed parallel beta-helix repeat-containing protein [Paracraurococcus ruber]|uniref:right-handed parallel beta-helix repeat-containing protein n=1 Tax=Paracraurococcus ruber TaxID=77675 RepID=UPI001864D108|nr:right-handed parallel beta-helix repeat-containing protein [Paracraurococcus ruber]
MTTITVGSGKQYATIAAAVAASRDGDVIQVQAGTYTNDFAEIRTKITLQGVGGMVHLAATVPPPNGKAILVTNTDVTIDHFEFSGTKVKDGNGAGIRYQGGHLTITNSYFHDNQDGLLGGTYANGVIDIRNTEFAHNGAGDGYTHNLYVGKIAALNIADSYFHDAVVGHEIKSRAAATTITNSRIFDNGGSASYSIDLPNGGHAVLTGNTIQQGAASQNPNIVAFGEEGGLWADNRLQMTNNTVLNDLGSVSAHAVWNKTTTAASISGTRIWGLTDAQFASGPANVTGSTHLGREPALDQRHPWGTAPTGTDGGTGGGSTGGTGAGGGGGTGAGGGTPGGGDIAPPGSYGTEGAWTQASAVWDGHRTYGGADYHTLAAKAPWGSVPAAQVAPGSWDPNFATHLAYDNFTRVRIDLHAAGTTPLDLLVVGAKNGALIAGNGDDTITWVAGSNAAGNDNTMAIRTGGGHDTVHVTAAGASTLAGFDATGNGSLWNAAYDGRYSTADITLGSGTASVTGDAMVRLLVHAGDGAATVAAGGGADVIYAGKGGLEFTGGAGADTLVLQRGAGHAVFEDFTAGSDRLRFAGLTAADISTKAATEGGVAGLLVTYDAAGDSVFLAHAAALSARDMVFA